MRSFLCYNPENYMSLQHAETPQLDLQHIPCMEKKDYVMSDGLYEVSIDTSAFHDDVVLSAQKEGIIFPVTATFEYSFGTATDMITSPFMKFISPFITILRMTNKSDDSDRVKVVVDVEAILSHIDRTDNSKTFPWPPNMPQEYKYKFLENALNNTWNHEKRHVLQYFLPKYDEQHKRGVKVKKSIQRVLLGLSTLGLSSGIVSLIYPLTEQQQKNLLFASLLLSELSLVSSMAILFYSTRLSRDEREAYAIKDVTGPFKVNKIE